MERIKLYLATALVGLGLMQLSLAQMLSGTVTSEGADAIPVPGARITVTVFQQSAEGLFDIELGRFLASTDAAGIYQVSLQTLLPLPTRTVRYVIAATHPQFHDCAFSVEGDLSAITLADFRMWGVGTDPAMVTGQTRETTSAYCGSSYCIIPLPDTRLLLTPERGATGHGTGSALAPTALADNSGKFVIIVPSDLAGQPLLLTGEKTGYVTSTSHAFLVPEPQRSMVVVNLYLAPAYPHCVENTAGGLKVSLCTDQASYNPGESVFMRYLVTNTANLTIKYDFTSSTQAVFTLSKNGIRVWSSPQSSLPVLTSLTLGPGESAVYDEVFNPQDLNCAGANCIMLGEYQVTAGLVGVDQTGITVTITFSEAAWTAPRALAIGYLEAYRMVGGYYLSYGTAGAGLLGYDIYDTTAPYDTLVGRLVKAFGLVFYRDCLGCPSILDVETMELVSGDRPLITYSITPSTPYLPTTHLTVYESGRTVYLYDTCPLCDNVKIPDVDTMISLADLNGLLNLFNHNNYWTTDSAYIDPGIDGAPQYALTCNGKPVTVYGTFPVEIQNIIKGLNDFIANLGVPVTPVGVLSPAAARHLNRLQVALRQHPFIRSAVIAVKTTDRQLLSLSISDTRGRLVRQVLNPTSCPPGIYELFWDGRSRSGRLVSPGMYFYSLVSPDLTINGKIIITK